MNGRNAAIYTRQDNAGTRYGYECPEERDYYPYWRSSMWRDMIIFTNTEERCDAYQEESQNVKDREECRFKDFYWDNVLYGYVSGSPGILPLDEEECLNMEGDSYWYENPDTGESEYILEWITIDNWGIDEPECVSTITTRVNHHGTPGGRKYWTYDWEIPNDITSIDGHDQCCIVRGRYNITTDDYQAWLSDDSIHTLIDYRNEFSVERGECIEVSFFFLTDHFY